MKCNQPKIEPKIIFNKPYYFLGENITGTIEINLNSETQISGISLEIILDEYWKVIESSGKTSSNSAQSVIVYKNLDLKQFEKPRLNGSKIFLPAGNTPFSFNINFTANECPSFEIMRPDFKAYIRYTFIVSIHSYNIFK